MKALCLLVVVLVFVFLNTVGRRNVIAVMLRNHESSSDAYLDMEILDAQAGVPE